jgi:hypothetical protein
MHFFKRHWVAVLVVSALLIGPLGTAAAVDSYTYDETPTGGMMMWDLLALRTTGIVATAVGSVFWVVSYPFAALGGNVDEATEALVQKPYQWTFERPLGEF